MTLHNWAQCLNKHSSMWNDWPPVLAVASPLKEELSSRNTIQTKGGAWMGYTGPLWPRLFLGSIMWSRWRSLQMVSDRCWWNSTLPASGDESNILCYRTDFADDNVVLQKLVKTTLGGKDSKPLVTGGNICSSKTVRLIVFDWWR